ncbi:MAG TPA: RNA methyltransferase [Candidatus Omnitrophota bacterium]|nr:RNA methyltransferase [Candidatus Omnitrophota bacterium]
MKPEHIAIILVASENADNIGAVARAIKNMGFCDFRLVRPPRAWRSKGKKMAMSAADILKHAKVFSSTRDAIRDLNFIVGATRRRGSGRGSFLSFQEAIARIIRESRRHRVGIVFGCESKGLANQDLQLCDYAVTIPASDAYPSLNLAQAVMVILFSLAQWQGGQVQSKSQKKEIFLNKRETEITLKHFAKALRVLEYQKGGANLLPRILQTTRGMIKRSGLLQKEAQMVKGLSRRICEKVLSCSKSKGRIN